MNHEKRDGPPAITPGARLEQGSHHATAASVAQGLETAAELRRNRARTLKTCGQTWHHFRRLGLTSETVRDTLQAILRDAA